MGKDSPDETEEMSPEEERGRKREREEPGLVGRVRTKVGMGAAAPRKRNQAAMMNRTPEEEMQAVLGQDPPSLFARDLDDLPDYEAAKIMFVRMEERVDVVAEDETEICYVEEQSCFFAKIKQSSKKQKSTEEVFLKNLCKADQEKMERALEKEWNKISVKKTGVVRVLSLEESEGIRRTKKHLIVPSRVVYTWKLEESKELMSDLLEREAKGRWTIKGYASPHLEEEHQEGKLTAPTLTQVGKMCALQSLASMGWRMELGDVSGAFLESDPMDKELYAEQPAEGVPGLQPGQLVLLLGPVYGVSSAALALEPLAQGPQLVPLRQEFLHLAALRRDLLNQRSARALLRRDLCLQFRARLALLSHDLRQRGHLLLLLLLLL